VPDDIASEKETWVLVGAVGWGKTCLIDPVKITSEFGEDVCNDVTGIRNFLVLFDRTTDPGHVFDVLQDRHTRFTPTATYGEVRSHSFQITVRMTDAIKPRINKDINLIDGPGGALLPAGRQVSREDEQLRGEYLEKVRSATTLLICLPSPGTSGNEADAVASGFDFEAQNLIEILNDGMRRKMPSLRRIAVCLTKYEARFRILGPHARNKALDPAEIVETWRRLNQQAMILNALKNVSEDVQETGNAPEIVVFPVSFYGFINGTGHANFEPFSGLPVILPFRPDTTITGTPVKLYPSSFTFEAVNRLWRPFNLMAPFAYLTTGSREGLLCLEIDELHRRLRTP